MTKAHLGQKVIAILLLLASLAMFALGGYGYVSRTGEVAKKTMDDMRSYAVLNASVSGLVREYVVSAKREAKAYSEAQKFTRNESKAYMEKIAAQAQAEAQALYCDFSDVRTENLPGQMDAVLAAQADYHALEDEEKAAYALVYADITAQAQTAEVREELSALMNAEYEAAAQNAEAATEVSDEGEQVVSVKVSYTYKTDSFLSEGKLPKACGIYDALDAQGKKIFAAALKGMGDEIYNEITGAEETVSEDDGGEERRVNYAYFAPSDALSAKEQAIYDAFDALWTEIRDMVPALTDEMREDSKEDILKIIDVYDLSYAKEFELYEAYGGAHGISDANARLIRLTKNAEMLLLLGGEALMLALVVLLYRPLVHFLGVPRLILLVFFVTLCIVSALLGIDVAYMLGNILKRTGMFGVLALAILPGIQCGIGLNLGMTVGCISGLLSTMIVLEYGLTGIPSLVLAIAGGILISIPVGWLYGQLLNRVKGDEMTISNYVGFSIVSLMCCAWMMLPFKNPKLTWILGTGLRVTHNLTSSFGGLLDNLFNFKLFGATVPTGLLLFLIAACFLVWLFSRSKTGIAMVAAGSNPRFAESAGISVDKMRILGTILSTVIAAVGIIVYSQSLGYCQLYNAPKQMSIISASAILIGGATISRGKVSHVIIGTFLFQGVLALGLQVANAAISGGGLSEITRIMISNGIILYALTQSGGESRA
ncbi:MAG: ABC transporter permease [Christensenellales bacterium]|jgi:simple sugar transport system permease protein